jgi:hypothetical protein
MVGELIKRYIIQKIDNEHAMVLDVQVDGNIINEYKINNTIYGNR